MKNIFVGGSSEIALNIARKIKNSDCISRKKNNLFENNYKIQNYSIKEIRKIIKTIDKKYDNILIFNGIYSESLVSFFSIKEFDKNFYINFKVPLIFATELIKNQNLKKGGSIFFFSSIAANKTEKGNAYYSISKNALNFMAKILANEQINRGNRINIISLGLINNKMGKSTLLYKINKQHKFVKKSIYISKILKILKNKKINKKIITIK
ncbi:SDR family oxidoreductase [Candidatus Pelagibacter sp.]|nr:SDR family oxidoreductase [Candidatus Pelagibacter sp.]